MPELDLDAPGTLVASATGATSFKILIVSSKPKYTAPAIEQNPGLAAADVVYESEWRPVAGAGATFDLGKLSADAKKRAGSLPAPAELKTFVLGANEGPNPQARPKVAEGPTLTVKKRSAARPSFDEASLKLEPVALPSFDDGSLALEPVKLPSFDEASLTVALA